MRNILNTDKAYIFGLIIGGGDFGVSGEMLRIRLPYKKWGAFQANPERAEHIASDIQRKVSPMFKAVYNLSVQYETNLSSGVWSILCDGDISAIKEDLTQFNINCEGEIKEHADISGIIKNLADDNMKRRFVAGFADTIGSVTHSHRRFDDEHQIISFEIKGYNYKFVCALCRLLYSINCIPDQINWNHPNIHCSSNPYYRQWNKGFKIRVLMDQFSYFGAFAFRTKAEAMLENRKLQKQTHSAKKCEAKKIHIKISAIHPAENDKRLPDVIRGGHYIHFHHICAVLGCEHAPYSKICSFFDKLGSLITPFPVLYKDSLCKIEEQIEIEPLFSQREYTISSIAVSYFKEIYDRNNKALLYGNGELSGYPISEIMQAVAYIIAEEDELHGKRAKKFYDVIQSHISYDNDLSLEVRKPEILTPLIIIGNDRGALVGARNPEVYSRLISLDKHNKYKVIVRKISEEDLKSD